MAFLRLVIVCTNTGWKELSSAMAIHVLPITLLMLCLSSYCSGQFIEDFPNFAEVDVRATQSYVFQSVLIDKFVKAILDNILGESTVCNKMLKLYAEALHDRELWALKSKYPS